MSLNSWEVHHFDFGLEDYVREKRRKFEMIMITKWIRFEPVSCAPLSLKLLEPDLVVAVGIVTCDGNYEEKHQTLQLLFYLVFVENKHTISYRHGNSVVISCE